MKFLIENVLAHGSEDESMMNNMMQNPAMLESMQRMMNGGGFSTFGLLELLTWLVWLVAGALLIIWLWRQINKK